MARRKNRRLDHALRGQILNPVVRADNRVNLRSLHIGNITLLRVIPGRCLERYIHTIRSPEVFLELT